MDLRGFGSVLNMEAIILGYDRATSDGLSEMGDNAGANRVAKRTIDQEEYNNLKQLGFLTKTIQTISQSALPRTGRPPIKHTCPNMMTLSRKNGAQQSLRISILQQKRMLQVNWNF